MKPKRYKIRTKEAVRRLKLLKTSLISIIISIIVTLTVFIPAKGFLFTNKEYTYGIVHKTVSILNYNVTPLLIVFISSFLISFIFSKEYISKLEYLRRLLSKHSFVLFDYIIRIIILSIFFTLICKSIITPKISWIRAFEEEAIFYLHNSSIIIGGLLSIIAPHIVFLGVNNNYSKALTMSEIDDLNRKHLTKVKEVNNKYAKLFKNSIKEGILTYNNDKFNEFINDTKGNEKYSLVIENNKNEVKYKKTKDFIEYYTNEGKYFNFDRQMKYINKKFNSLDLESTNKYLKNILHTDICEQLLNTINLIESNDLKDIDETEIKSYISKLKVDLENLLQISKDVEKYIQSRFKYLKKYYNIAKKGYEGELRVEKELNKYNDYIVSIRNKCFNFKHIDFIPEEYTMECDNILVTQRGVFVIETKNYGSEGIYAETSSNNKNTIYIEESGRWVVKYQSGKKEVLDKTPVQQNKEHILKLEKIINHHLGYDKFHKRYVEVKGIIVIANNDVDIENDLKGSFDICRPEAIFETIMKYPKNNSFTNEMIDFVVDTINSYTDDLHKPISYNLVNVSNELKDIEKQLNKIVNDKGYYADIKAILENYHTELQELTSELSENISSAK